jgi:tetratricopeptide (TPR) repeat protein
MAGGSKKKARQQAEEIVKHDAVMGNAILADIHVKDEEYDLAIEKYRQCIEAQPENVHLRYRMGMLYQQLEQWEDAFESFEQVLEIEPGSQGALYQIGRTAAFSGKHIDRAMECLQAYLTMEIRPGYPGYDGAHWRLGMLYEHKGDLARAREEYETARRLNPDEDKYLKSLEELAKE